MGRSKLQTYKIMSSIKSKNTKPELQLGSAMWALGLRYRKHYPIIGKPDFLFLKARIAVFCDGDYWHGNNWKIRGLRSFKEELNGYTQYWRDKIMANVKRDQIVNRKLEEEGWRVLRYWESTIKENPVYVAKKIKSKLDQKINLETVYMAE